MSAPGNRPAPELIEGGFGVEIADAPLLHNGLNLADIAHVLALRERGIVADEPAGRLLGVLLDAHKTPVEEFGYDPAFGEAYNSRERRFTAEIGTDASWLHAGRPRREAVRIAMRLRLRRDALDLIDAACDVVRATSTLAAEHAETFMADQTYLQHAQPSTFGHYLLSFAYPVQREIDRLFDDLAWVNRSPAGAGGVNGSRLGYDRSRVAERLGFDGVIEHTRDAMWQADGLIKIVSTAVSLVTTLAKLAEDLEIWSSTEFDYVSLADGHTRSSVLMPQKRNPYALTMVRGEAGVLIGRLTGMFAISKTPSARSDNLIFAYGEVPRALELAGKATRLMAGVIAGLSVNAERMYDALEGGFSQAADLADYTSPPTGWTTAPHTTSSVPACAPPRRRACAAWTSPPRCSTRQRGSAPASRSGSPTLSCTTCSTHEPSSPPGWSSAVRRRTSSGTWHGVASPTPRPRRRARGSCGPRSTPRSRPCCRRPPTRRS